MPVDRGGERRGQLPQNVRRGGEALDVLDVVGGDGAVAPGPRAAPGPAGQLPHRRAQQHRVEHAGHHARGPRRRRAVDPGDGDAVPGLAGVDEVVLQHDVDRARQLARRRRLGQLLHRHRLAVGVGAEAELGR